MDRIRGLIYLIPLIAALWVSRNCAIELWGYIRLSQKVGVETAEWTAHERSPGSFFLQADYTFSVSGQKIFGKTNFDHPVFSTTEQASSFIKAIEQIPWTVYYDKNAPFQNSLQKIFPLLI
ncbi:MAG: hypothetical protein EB051_03520, partial [Chlamydiia bacterium]|nr:hypothetical protein [Chlamydiia bacterium]